MRTNHSKDRLEAAFVTLLKTTPYERITVSAITRQAKVNRGTFYLNYLDKEDLRSQLFDRLFAEVEQILTARPLPANRIDCFDQETLEQIIAYVQANFALLRPLLASDMRPQITARLKESLATIFSARQVNLQQSRIRQPYANELVLGGIVTIFVLWIDRDLAESPAELLGIIEKYRDLSPDAVYGAKMV